MKSPFGLFKKRLALVAISAFFGLSLIACDDDSGNGSVAPEIPVIEEPESSDSVEEPAEELSSAAETPKSSSSRIMTPSEEKKSFGACNAENRDVIRIGQTSKTNYICDGKVWREANAAEVSKGICSEEKNKSVMFSADSKYWRCNGSEWVTIDAEEYAMGSCLYAKHGKIDRTRAVDYLCSIANEWIACDKEHESTMVDRFACVNGEWRSASLVEQMIGYLCSVDVEGKMESVESGSDTSMTVNYYVCSKSYWREVDSLTYFVGAVCNENTVTSYSADKKYQCTQVFRGYAWKAVEMSSSSAGSSSSVTSSSSISSSSAVRSSSSVTSSSSSVVKISSSSEAPCNSSNVNSVVGGKACVESGVLNYSWRDATSTEIAAGAVCAFGNSGKVFGNYVCEYISGTGYKWRSADYGESKTGLVCNSSIASTKSRDWVAIGDEFFICYDDGKGKGAIWHTANAGTVATKSVCGMDTPLYTLEKTSTGTFTCTESGWREATAAEIKHGKGCDPSYLNRFVWVFNSAKDQYEGYRCRTYIAKDEYYFEKHIYQTKYYEGESYDIIDIGDQVWFAENLRHSNKILRTSSGFKMFVAPISNDVEYNDSIKTYGRLYTWAAAMDSVSNASDNFGAGMGYGVAPPSTITKYVRGMCPTGWHIPYDRDWNKLIAYTKVDQSPWNLASAGYSFDWTLNGKKSSGYDTFGFNAIPSGSANYSTRKETYVSRYGHCEARYWTANAEDGVYAKIIGINGCYNGYLNYEEESVSKKLYYPIRCVKD